MREKKRISRRVFFGKAAGTAGALFLPNIITSPALGGNGRTPASERITMGFIGLGGQGSGHLLGGAWTYVPGGYMARDDVQVLAVCDVRRERREHARQRCNQIYAEKTGQGGYSGVKACNDFREILDRSDIDAVLIAVPYHWAAPMSAMALRSGKDVYCEKPIAITVREGRAMAEACRRYDRVYQAGTQQRSEYGGKFRLACELVRNGRIGRLMEVYAYRQPGAFFPTWTPDQSQAVPDGFDWDLWLGPLPWRPYAGSAGHALTDCFVGDVNWSPHHYDFVRWAVNPDDEAPIEVRYEGGDVHYRFSNGVIVRPAAHPEERVGAEGGACFVGTEGRIAADRNSIVACPEKILAGPLLSGDKRVYRAGSHSGNFLECVRSRRRTICDAETAVQSMNTILIGGIALALRRSLTWDPVKEEFIGDGHADRFLSYAYRHPWRAY